MPSQWRCCSSCQMIFLPPDANPEESLCHTCQNALPMAEDAGPFDDGGAPVALPYDGSAEDVATAETVPSAELPPDFSDTMAVKQPPEWFFVDDQNQKVGPANLEVLRELVTLGWMRPTFMLQPKGTDDWVMAQTVPGLFPGNDEPGLEPAAVVAEPVAVEMPPVPESAHSPAVAVEEATSPDLPAFAAEPAPTDESPQWYFIDDQNQKVGPAGLDVLRELVALGWLRRTYMLQPTGSDIWVMAQTIPDLFPADSPEPAEASAFVALPIEEPPPAAVPEPVPVAAPTPSATPEPLPDTLPDLALGAVKMAAPLPIVIEEPVVETPVVAEAISPEPIPVAAEPTPVIPSAIPVATSPAPVNSHHVAAPVAVATVAPPAAPQVLRFEPQGSADEIAARFRSAWWQGKRPELVDYLPSEGEKRRSALPKMARIDLECRLNCKEPVRVESYLEKHPDLADDRANLLDMIGLEYNQRRRAQPAPTVDDYIQRFPQFATELKDRLQPPAPPAPVATRPIVPSESTPLPTARIEPRPPTVPAPVVPPARPELQDEVMQHSVQFAREHPIEAGIIAGYLVLAFLVFIGMFARGPRPGPRQPVPPPPIVDAGKREPALQEERDRALAAKVRAELESAQAHERAQAAHDNELRALEREKIARENELKARADEKKAMEETIRTRMALEQSSVAWHRQLAEQWEKAGVWPAAVHHLGRLIDLTPNDEKLWLRRAQANQNAGDWLAAAADYERAGEIKPDPSLRVLRDDCLRHSLPVRAGGTIGLAASGTWIAAPAFYDLPGAPSR